MDEGFKEYVMLRQQSRFDAGLKRFPEGLIEKQIKELSNSTRVFVVEHDGKAISGQIVQNGQNIFTLTGVCTSKIAYQKQLNANDFMQYSIVSLAIKEGTSRLGWSPA